MPMFWGDFWSFLWFLFEMFVWVASIFLIVYILIDVYRDHTLAVGWKVLWTIVLLFFPLFGALVYIIARGKGMAERMQAREGRPPEDDAYRPQASSSPSEDISRAKALLDSGAISQGEFDALKSKALGHQYFG